MAATMSRVEAVREFVNRRLSAAAEEIFSVFLPTLVQNQEQIQTQQRLLQICRRETTKSQRTDESQQHFCRKEQLWSNQQHSSLDQEPPEPLQMKEEQEEPEPLQMKEEQEEPELPHMKEEQEEPEPPEIKEELLGGNQFADTIMVTVVGWESEPEENLDSDHSVREFISQRLTAAAGEIFTEFQQTLLQYQQEIQTQQRLLEIALTPQIKLHRIDGPQQQMSSLEGKEPEAPQIKEEQEEPEAPQIKEEQEEPEAPQIEEEEAEFSTSHDEEQLVLKQGVDDFMMNPTYEQSQPIEPEPDSERLLFQDSVVAGSQHQEKIHLVDSGSTTAGLESKKRHHSSNVENSPFTLQSSLSVSRKTCTGEKPHSCEICGKTFNSRSFLLIHMKIHSDKPFSCETCGKSFTRKSVLLIHTMVHSVEKPFPCDTCGKSFSQQGQLLIHMRCHSKEKPYPCETCGKSFRTRNLLLLHNKIHSGEKPHLCVMCGTSFRLKSLLLGHIRSCTGEKPLSCVKW